VFRGQSSLEFTDTDYAIIVAIKSGNHITCDILIYAELSENFVELISGDLAIAIFVQQTEGLSNRESLV